MVTAQEPVPLQSPDHPANSEPASAEAVRVTLVSTAKSWLQVEPQLMPLGELVTVPLPAPDLETVRPHVVGADVLDVPMQVLL